MTTHRDIIRQRLHNQQIAAHAFDTPEDIVAWLGAVQAQDYLGGLWGVGLRMREATEKRIEQSLAAGAILRTWPMRGTLHFVAAADARWMLELMTPRVIAAHRNRLLREYALDDRAVARAGEVVAGALEGGGQLSREEIYARLEEAHIPTANQRGLHIIGQLAQKGLICFGARQGKQQRLTLLAEWVPDARPLERDEALAELTRRYFTGHGPATVQDCMWWSGLTAADVRKGIAMAGAHLAHRMVEGRAYWFSSSMKPAPAATEKTPSAHLLPNFDEYTVGYRERDLLVDPALRKDLSPAALLSPVLVVDGLVVGNWKRTLTRNGVVVEANARAPLNGAQSEGVARAAERYGAFLELPVIRT